MHDQDQGLQHNPGVATGGGGVKAIQENATSEVVYQKTLYSLRQNKVSLNSK
jgi:hypothetical protein